MRSPFVVVALVAVGAAGCAARGTVGEDARSGLATIPAVDGDVAIAVVYPPAGSTIAVRDSNFIFGSVGSGRATLRIDGAPVEVAPNGAFLAFLPVPASGVYRIEATKDGRSVTAAHEVRIPSPDTVASYGATILAATMTPTGAVALPAGEAVEVGFRGTAGGEAWILLPTGARVPLLQSVVAAGPTADAQNFLADPSGGARRNDIASYRGSIPAQVLRAEASVVARPTLGGGRPGAVAVASDSARTDAVFVLAVRGDTSRLPLPLNLSVVDPLGRVGVVTAPADAPHDWMIRGRPSTAGPFHWFFPPGTRLHIDGERGAFYRVRLARDLAAWVPKGEVTLEPAGAPLPAADVGGVRFVAADGWVDLRIPLRERLPFQVDGGASSLTLDVYGATSETNFFQYGSLDPLIERAMWSQPIDGVYRVSIALTEPLWGWQPFFDGTTLVLRIRRPPRIDPVRPLAGLYIGVDPGHPPGGGTGPTGLTEAEANLAVAQKLVPLLEAAGARVLMLRTTPDPVDLGLRPRMAADSGVHVLVSIHNNAFPDGVNPFTNAGTSAYYYQPQSLDLARAVQAALLAALGTRDIGIGRADLALVRPTWMPSVLSETLYMMLPQHEATLRDPAAQERIARAHLQALETFLRDRAVRATH